MAKQSGINNTILELTEEQRADRTQNAGDISFLDETEQKRVSLPLKKILMKKQQLKKRKNQAMLTE